MIFSRRFISPKNVMNNPGSPLFREILIFNEQGTWAMAGNKYTASMKKRFTYQHGCDLTASNQPQLVKSLLSPAKLESRVHSIFCKILPTFTTLKY